jgi:hypothetical protein
MRTVASKVTPAVAAVLVVLFCLPPHGSAQRASRAPDAAPAREGLAGYLLSARGRTFARLSGHPMAQGLLKLVGEKSLAAETPAAAEQTAAAVTIQAAAAPCLGQAGARFNLEARTLPGAMEQNETAVDFLAGGGLSGSDLVVGVANDFRGMFGLLGSSATGYYVHRAGTGPDSCGADFEGGIPALNSFGQPLIGGGDAYVEADAARNAFYVADNRFAGGVSAIALFRSSAGVLNGSGTCPDGTHTAQAAQRCWPSSIAAIARADGSILVKPHLAIDPRTGGTAAGDVYVSAIRSTIGGSFPVLAACTNNLTACSPEVLLSSSDSHSRSAHVRVRPDVAQNPKDAITITYVNVTEAGPPEFFQTFEIKYVVCTPKGAPNAPVCNSNNNRPPVLVTAEDHPIPDTGGGLGGGSLGAAQFLISTYPKHEHRQDANGVETYVVWDHCQVQNTIGRDVCPDAGISLAASNNNGRTWSFAPVDTGVGDQYFPWIRTDPGNTVNIVYYSTQADSGKHRAQVLMRQIPPGPRTPDAVTAATVVTPMPMDPSGSFFLGDAFIGFNIGVAARTTSTGRRMYIHFMHNSVDGLYNGAPAPDQNNHLARIDYP